jgi:hypothetical protein
LSCAAVRRGLQCRRLQENSESPRFHVFSGSHENNRSG